MSASVQTPSDDVNDEHKKCYTIDSIKTEETATRQKTKGVLICCRIRCLKMINARIQTFS